MNKIYTEKFQNIVTDYFQYSSLCDYLITLLGKYDLLFIDEKYKNFSKQLEIIRNFSNRYAYYDYANIHNIGETIKVLNKFKEFVVIMQKYGKKMESYKIKIK